MLTTAHLIAPPLVRPRPNGRHPESLLFHLPECVVHREAVCAGANAGHAAKVVGGPTLPYVANSSDVEHRVPCRVVHEALVWDLVCLVRQETPSPSKP